MVARWHIPRRNLDSGNQERYERELSSLKIMIDIPHTTFRRAKALATTKGLPLKQLLAAIIDGQLRDASPAEARKSPWMKLFGAFAKSKEMRAETRQIQKLIDDEFERIDSTDRK